MNYINKFLNTKFKRSEDQTGYLYVCSVRKRIVCVPTGEVISDDIMFKYGKTKDIEKRMLRYGKAYELIKCWKVNHLSLREKLIHDSLEEYRYERCINTRDEHVYFNCIDDVDYYANAKISRNKDKIEIVTDDDTETHSILELLDLLQLK